MLPAYYIIGLNSWSDNSNISAFSESGSDARSVSSNRVFGFSMPCDILVNARWHVLGKRNSGKCWYVVLLKNTGSQISLFWAALPNFLPVCLSVFSSSQFECI